MARNAESCSAVSHEVNATEQLNRLQDEALPPGGGALPRLAHLGSVNALGTAAENEERCAASFIARHLTHGMSCLLQAAGGKQARAAIAERGALLTGGHANELCRRAGPED